MRDISKAYIPSFRKKSSTEFHLSSYCFDIILHSPGVDLTTPVRLATRRCPMGYCWPINGLLSTRSTSLKTSIPLSNLVSMHFHSFVPPSECGCYTSMESCRFGLCTVEGDMLFYRTCAQLLHVPLIIVCDVAAGM